MKWRMAVFILSMIALVPSVWAFPKYSVNGDLDLRYAAHADRLNEPSSEKLEASFTQNAKYTSSFSGVFSGRILAEEVYPFFPLRYPEPLRDEDTLDARLMDFYLQYKSDHFLLRAGQQTVVWSETFSLPNADIVNPKDFRDGGLGSLSSLRLPVPMINGQIIFSNITLQGIYLPQPQFNLLPLPGSDFSFPYQSVISAPEIEIHRQRNLPWSPQFAEKGARASFLLGSLDLSAFYFDAYDRSPFYTLDPASNPLQKIVIDENHSRISTAGLTGTFEKSSVVYRFEAFQSKNRQRTVLTGPTLSTVLTDELVYVLGMDFPTWQKINFGVQWSESYFSTRADYLERPQRESIFSAHLHRPLFSNHDLQLIYAFATVDGGQRFSLDYTLPVSNSTETHFGADVFGGPKDSEFGRIDKANRIYISIRSFFAG